MTDSFVKTYKYDNGEIQRVQAVTPDSFDNIDFLRPAASRGAFEKIVNLYENFIVPKMPQVFGRMVLFTVPDELREKGLIKVAEIFGEIKGLSTDAALAYFMRKRVRVAFKNGKAFLECKDESIKKICDELMKSGFLKIVCGKLPCTKILPVSNEFGFLSEAAPEAEVKVNSHFFVMDCFDVNSIFDRIGTPIGLMIKNGIVKNPPLYDREAFLVHGDDRVEIRKLNLSEFSVKVGNVCFKDGENCRFLERPKACKLVGKPKGLYVVIVGCKVEGVLKRGGFSVPAAGFVLETFAKDVKVAVGDLVEFESLSDVKFGIQVGNSVIVNGEKTSGFVSKFYNIYRGLGAKAYPPSLYPLDYERARAARIALGANGEGRPVILWAEGSKKTGYVAGEQSCGASLSELADIAADLGLVNAVNLDGGGSAQILYRGTRTLDLTDRNPSDDTAAERAVPAGLCIF